MTENEPLQRPVREIQEKSSFKWMALLLILVIAGLLYYQYGGNFSGLSIETPFSSSSISPSPGETAERKVAKMPDPSTSLPENLSAGSQALPADQQPIELDSSDDSVGQDLESRLNNPVLVRWLGDEELIRKTVAVVDNAARGSIARKILDLPIPNEALQISADASSLTYDQQSYARYNDYVGMILALDGNTLGQLYLQYRPLLQQAYAELGDPTLNFDDALAAAFRLALDTPEINGPFQLQRVEGRNVFVDKEIEALPDLQKLLIRIGPDNRARVKEKVAELQSILFQAVPATGQ